jgi:3-hydroxybutyrate dehydrogenase
MNVHATAANSTTGHPRPLAGRTAVVTGSTSGIGLGIAKALAGAGANLVINGFGDPRSIEQTRLSLEAAGEVAVRFDGSNLAEQAGVATLIEGAMAAFGQVDILVNNAGIQHVAPVEAFPPERWDAIIALNLSAAFHATRAVFAGMKERSFGRIVNIASAHGLVGSPFKSAYVAAKHGIVGFTKAVALEGAEYGITVNAICPGYVWTPLVEKQIEEQAKAHGIARDRVVKDILLAAQPNKRFASVEEIGALTVFLASEAGASMTGTAIPVDGAWTAH